MLNFQYIIKCLFPSFMRKPKQVAWLLTVTSSLQELYSEFLYFKNSIEFLTRFTGQTIYLEKLLSDTFKEKVKIETVEPIKPSVIVHKDEGEFADYVENVNHFLVLTKEEVENDYNFVVLIKNLTPEIEAKAKKIIKRYLIYNLKFKIRNG